MKQSSYQAILHKLLQNKVLVFCTIFTAVLCFGFTITNHSIGLDDPARNYYFYSLQSGNMIQQGRLLHLALNYVTRSIEFIPFFTDFVGASLFTLSAFLFCALFQYVTEGKLQTFSLTAFSCTYISFPTIAEKFIYQLDVIAIMLSYCCCALALFYAYQFACNPKPLVFLKSLAVLIVSIASYESYIFLYFCGVFVILILEIIFTNHSGKFFELLWRGLKYAVILFAAICIYYGSVYLLQIVTNQAGVFSRYTIWEISSQGYIGIFVEVTQSIIDFFKESISARYIPILSFCAFSTALFVLSIILAIKHKNIWLIICCIALWLGNFFIHYISGSFMLRAAQTLCLFDGFVLMLLIETFEKKKLFRNFIAVATILLIFIQSADMSRWFYIDYIRYRKETFVIDTIATKLVAECNLSKPVVFTNSPYEGYLTTKTSPVEQAIGDSVLYWSGYAFEDKTQPFVSELFRMHGYDFIHSPSETIHDQATIAADTMPSWPENGCIQEFDTFIVVNFG